MYVDTFFSHCTRPFANFIQLCGHNRARQRDKLAHLLEEFTSLQDEVIFNLYSIFILNIFWIFFRQRELMLIYIIYR